MQAATATGQHNATRERALSYLWSLVKHEESSEKPKRYVWQTSTRTELVKVFLDERDNSAAWDAFNGGPVATHIWSQMAAVRAKTHPHDAIALYHRLLPIAVVNGTANARYEEAFGIVRTIGKLRADLNQHAEFAGELENIRKTYRAAELRQIAGSAGMMWQSI